MTASSLLSRRGLGGFLALLGGVLMIVSAFLPWLGGGSTSATGWDVYETLSNAGYNGLYEQNFFADEFSPFFSGLVVVIAGGLLVLIGLAMLASLRGGASSLPVLGQALLVTLALIIAVVGVANLVSLYARGPGADVVRPEYGLFMLTAAAIFGFLGVLAALSGRRS